MASSPFAFITILTTDTVNKTTSDEIAIGATNPCIASQNTSSMVNNNLSPHLCKAQIAAKQRRQIPKPDESLHTDEKVSIRGDNEETAEQFSSLLAT